MKGAEKELASAWPSIIDDARSREALTLQDIDAGARQDLVAMLRRCGVRPLEAKTTWDATYSHLPTDALARQAVKELRVDRLLLVTGHQGTGRSSVLSRLVELLRSNDEKPLIALHEPLTSEHAGTVGAALYDWVTDLVAAGNPIADFTDMEVIGFPTDQFPAEVLSGLQLDDRVKLSRAQDDMAVVDLSRRVEQAALLLERIAESRSVVLVIDHFCHADATSQELVRTLARRLRRRPGGRLSLVIQVEDQDRAQAIADDGCAEVRVDPDVGAFLTAVGVSPELVSVLLARKYSPTQCITLLRTLADMGSIRHVKPNGWVLKKSIRSLPEFSEIIQWDVDALLPPAVQQTLEVGAIYGMSFPLAAADHVASNGSGNADRLREQLASHDPDASVVRLLTGDGGRVAFTNSVWWQHFRSRRLDELTLPGHERELQRLADALNQRADRFDDWQVAAELYEHADMLEQSGVAFLRSAAFARKALSTEAASAAYARAAEKFSVCALQLPTTRPAERARHLAQAAYCWYRAATAANFSADFDPMRNTHLASAEQSLDQALRELTHPSMVDTSTLDLDEMVVEGTDVGVDPAMRLRLQCRSLTAFVNAERGTRLLRRLGPRTKDEVAGKESHLAVTNDEARQALDSAAGAFRVALSSAEEGLRGWMYEVLAIRSGAGLAYAMALNLAVSESEGSLEDRRTALFHAARARMMFGFSGRCPIPPDERDALVQLGEAASWAATARTIIVAPERTTPYDPQDEMELVDLLSLLVHHMHGTKTAGHGHRVARFAQMLINDAADVRPFHQHDPTLSRDLTIAALAHDLFRWVDGSRILQLARDLGQPVSSAEWHNPLLLHGRLAALFLEHDLGVGTLLGRHRMARLGRAIDHHTLGVSGDDTAVTAQNVLGLVLCLADSADREGLALPRSILAACQPGALTAVYRERRYQRLDDLRAEGRSVSTSASSNQPVPVPTS